MYEPSLKMPFIIRWPGVIKPGSVQDAMAINPDFAPTFLDAAGLPVPADMQGRSLLPVLRGRTPADWRTSMYYRYYHDPGDHNTRGALRRSHRDAQADLLLEERSVGAVRPRERSPRDAQSLRPAGSRSDHRDAQERARAFEDLASDQESGLHGTRPNRTGWTGRAAPPSGSRPFYEESRSTRRFFSKERRGSRSPTGGGFVALRVGAPRDPPAARLLHYGAGRPRRSPSR